MESGISTATGMARSPLEAFLRDYAETAGGVWDEVEPQVYDLMLPVAPDDQDGRAAEPEIVRIAFDPEAIPEHPGAQLASFGTPLVNRLLADAVDRGHYARLFLVGLSVPPQGLETRVSRALSLPDGHVLRIERMRWMHFPQAVFWFEATFASDQKEQEILPVAIDLHYGRQVRHLDRLLDHSRLAEKPSAPLAEAPHEDLAKAYLAARDRVVRTLAALSNSRSRELKDRLDRQVERMTRYYSDLRTEVEEQAQRASKRNEDPAKFTARRESLEREERMRIAELRQKSTLTVHLRLVNLVVIQQPKLLLHAAVHSMSKGAPAVSLVWDPLIESLEAVPCPDCRQPTFELKISWQGRLLCAACGAKTPAHSKTLRR